MINSANPSRVTELLKINYPLIQGGMIWASGWRLASAVSNAGGLGLLGAGSMYPEVLEEQIKKCKEATNNVFGVNIPLLYPNIEEHLEIILREKIPVVFTSAGNPKTWTAKLKAEGITVVHVVSSVKFALKAQEAGVDAVVAEGFEAGGHNGREETTSLVLIPAVKAAIDIPLIAAGGIGSGRAMLAAFCLGADGVQVGSRFVASHEASSHALFKQEVLKAKEGDTVLTLKELAPVRLLKNPFYEELLEAYANCASPDELRQILGRARAKRGMFEGDLEQGELEIGQVSCTIHELKSAEEIIEEMISECKQLQSISYI